jgi:hypothetical protein
MIWVLAQATRLGVAMMASEPNHWVRPEMGP